MLKKENKLIKLAKDLNFKEFKPLYLEYLDEYDSPDICLISEIYKNYPKVEKESELNDIIIEKRVKNEKNILDFLTLITSNAFSFENDIIKRKHNEVIKFDILYRTIGYEYSDCLDGNNIIHMQSSGLHISGIEHLMKQDTEIDIHNNNGHNPFDILFLEHYPAYEQENAFILKRKIAKLLLPAINKEQYKSKENLNIIYQIIDFQLNEYKTIIIDEIKLIIELLSINVFTVRHIISQYRKKIRTANNLKYLAILEKLSNELNFS